MSLTRRPVVSLALALATLAVVSLTATGAEPATGPKGPARRLAWAFRAGESLRYQFDQKNVIRTRTGGQETVSTNTLMFVLTWDVKTVAADGSAEVAMTVDRVRVNVSTGGAEVGFDSRDARPGDASTPRSPLAAVYSAAVGRVYHLRLDARGRVAEARVPAAVTEAVQGSSFGAVADGGSLLSERGVKNLFAQVFPTLPDQAVAKGAAWSQVVEVPTSPLGLNLTFRQTVADLGTNSARIEATIETALRPEANLPFRVDMVDQSGLAAYAVDTAAGRFTSSTIRQEVDLVVVQDGRETGQSVLLDLRTKFLPGVKGSAR
jgi:hypothetical protein